MSKKKQKNTTQHNSTHFTLRMCVVVRRRSSPTDVTVLLQRFVAVLFRRDSCVFFCRVRVPSTFLYAWGGWGVVAGVGGPANIPAERTPTWYVRGPTR